MSRSAASAISDDGYDMTWSKVPDGVVYTSIPHYAPVNEPDTWLLNIAKWKAHGMCLTQSVKNEQGLVVLPYVRFCPGWKMVTGAPEFMQPNIQPRRWSPSSTSCSRATSA